MNKPTAAEYVKLLLTQKGNAYLWDSKPKPSEDDPKADGVPEDCSGLVSWGANHLKVVPTMPDGSVNQFEHCRQHDCAIPIEQAIYTPGALIFRLSNRLGNHVVTSLGDGRTIEAKGRAFGVVIDHVKGRVWTHAALIPGLDYGK